MGDFRFLFVKAVRVAVIGAKPPDPRCEVTYPGVKAWVGLGPLHGFTALHIAPPYGQ